MPIFPLGRLFWKFLVFFFLAQAVTIIGVGLAIWLEHDPHLPPPYEPPSATASSPNFAPPPGLTAEQNAGSPPPPPARRGPKPPVMHIIAGALVSLIFAALLAIYISRPIQRLRQALQAGANGQLTPGLSDAMGKRRDELADLGHDFDRMAQHLAQLMEGQRSLLFDVSHELRAPLARLQAVIGLARQQPEALDNLLTRLEHESQRMDRLLSELLTLSRLESGMVGPRNEAVDLAELLVDVVDDAAPEARQADCTIDLQTCDGALVHADPEMLHRLFDNLLRNALKHATSGKWVGMTVRPTLPAAGTEAGEIVVCVEDRGPGVPDNELGRLFTPFYRGQHAAAVTPENGHAHGHGLGLAIARQIAENHHGRIEAENRPGGGFRVTVTLPRLEASDNAADPAAS
ncbi:sensor histidine kinase [Propionivibrio limicola]|uniref:sensor histidine kinase n=1 Tax=Propionivibrio limicola TaxID=167645 RepID=UPI001292216D|nr:HAMP domain-containing sensor histidine kinase [Propionivibrio limicola]